MNVHAAFGFWTGAVLGILCLGVLLARLAALIVARSERGLLMRRHTVIAEYDSPGRFSPAELGYIVDATFSSNELLATIARLYAKGVVVLESSGDADFTITVINDDQKRPVDDAEASILGYLRTMLRSKTTWSRLNALLSDVAGPRSDLDDATLQSLVAKGLLVRGAAGAALFRKHLGAAAAATAGTVLATLPIWAWGHAALAASGLSAGFYGIDRGLAIMALLPVLLLIWFAWFIYVNMLTYIYLQRSGVPVGATDELRALWPDVAGFQLFLRETEYVRLQHDPNPHDPSMAYCLALGLDPGFIKSLKL